MYFYKYQRTENLAFSMLRRGEVFFASTSELNDANECRPRLVLQGSEELWNRLAQFILEEVCFCSEYQEQATDEEVRQLLGLDRSVGKLLKKRVRNQDLGIERLGTIFVDALRLVLERKVPVLHSQLILKLSRNFIDRRLPGLLVEPRYIASFSKNPKNPTMWGHYAGAETGFVIVYATDDGKIKVQSPIKILFGTRPLVDGTLEVDIYNEQRLELRPVIYGRKPPKVNAFHLMIPKFSYSEEDDHYDVPLLLPAEAREKEESKIGFVKFSDWRYEQEIRAFYPVPCGPLQPDVRVLGVSIDHIQGLIFGPKMTNTDKERAVLCCHLMRESLGYQHLDKDEPLPEFAFFQARQVLDRFDFDILPVGILDGSYFGYQLPLKPLKELDEVISKRLRGMSERIASGS